MTGSGEITADYYRRRLEEFLAERHPQLTGARELVATRSNRAYAVYRTTLAQGFSPLKATARADAVLYEGLIFSRYDLLRDILATDYPQIPEYQLRRGASALRHLCSRVRFVQPRRRHSATTGIRNARGSAAGVPAGICQPARTFRAASRQTSKSLTLENPYSLTISNILQP